VAKTREIILHCPADVQAAVREIFVTANDDEAINSKLETWLEGRNGAALSARYVSDGPTRGTFEATLELTEGFREFLQSRRTVFGCSSGR